MIKCIHINVEKGIIDYVHVEKDNLQQYYKLIGCKCIEAAYPSLLEARDVIYVDEEGLLKGQTNYFWIKGHQQPFAGSGLVIGTTEDGESCDVTTDLDKIRHNTLFGVTGV